jgi:hypothetical protein
MTEEDLKKLKDEALEAIESAAAKMYKYACECELGDERIWAFETYDTVRRSRMR